MNLKEYEGKEIFRKYNISIPNSYLINSLKDVKIPENEVILKAQVPSGKRKKLGGVVTASKDNIKNKANELFNRQINGFDVKQVLVEEKLEVKKEYYLAITIDRFERDVFVLFSESGGIDIEDNKRIKKIPINQLDSFRFRDLAQKLFKIFNDYDAELVEINPLAETNKGLVALDSKIVIDDNSLFRHEFKQDLSLLEKQAKTHGLSYVELDGNIGVIGNGAGLVMATLDIIGHFGGGVANFLDLGGGADCERMEQAMKLVLSNNPEAIFINIFGGITRCDDIAKGLVNFKNNYKIAIPIVVRMIGTNEQEAKRILEQNNIHHIDSMEEGAKKIVSLVK